MIRLIGFAFLLIVSTSAQAAHLAALRRAAVRNRYYGNGRYRSQSSKEFHLTPPFQVLLSQAFWYGSEDSRSLRWPVRGARA